MDFEVALCLPHDAKTVALIRAIVADALLTLGVTRDCVEDIRLSLSEACSNVIAHAAATDEYEVRVHLDRHRCVISVANTGDGFDAAALTGVMPDPQSARGRGVAIMRAVMDSVEFTAGPMTGTIVQLVKSLTLEDGSPLALLP